MPFLGTQINKINKITAKIVDHINAHNKLNLSSNFLDNRFSV